MIKNSRQREAIKNCLKHRTDHPTAETIYLHVKKEFPNISLGTVYRNLSLLAELGEIVKIQTTGDSDRFDGNIDPHYHVVCRTCGCVMDLDMKPLGDLDQLASEEFDGIIEAHTIQFVGQCPDCVQKVNSLINIY